MPDLLETKILSYWDGKDTQTDRLAELLLTFPDLEPPDTDILGKRTTTELFFLIEFEKHIQTIADTRFESDQVRIKTGNIKRGSLEIIIAILTIGGVAVFKFFKDYKAVKEGVLLFADDLQKAGTVLHDIASKKLGKQKGHRPDETRQQRPNEQERGKE